MAFMAASLTAVLMRASPGMSMPAAVIASATRSMTTRSFPARLGTAKLAISRGSLRADRVSVTRVMSSSCAHPGPVNRSSASRSPSMSG